MNTQPVILNPELETRKLTWFMMAILIGMAVLAAMSQPALLQPLRLAPFALLMLAHLGLHWRAARFMERPGGMTAYLVAQGLLAAGLVFLAGHMGLAFALAMALVGESIGMYGVTRRGVLAAIYFLIVSLGMYTWVSGQTAYDWWSLTLIPMVVFVVIYVELYNRQANANARARELLAELEAANRQLSEYAAQVEDLTIAAERQRIARELHDTLSQGLAGLVLQLEAADAHLAAGRTERGRQIVLQTMDGARAALTGARRAIDTLRAGPAAGTSEVSFEAALRAEVERFQAATGVECRLVHGTSLRGSAATEAISSFMAGPEETTKDAKQDEIAAPRANSSLRGSGATEAISSFVANPEETTKGTKQDEIAAPPEKALGARNDSAFVDAAAGHRVNPSLRGGRSLPDEAISSFMAGPEETTKGTKQDEMAGGSEGDLHAERASTALSAPIESAEHLLRIATEALNNIARHARATQVLVRIAYLEDGVQLEIQDNGCGFDPAAIPAGHYGLLGMRERARLAGGWLEIDSLPGEGTTVRARIPQP